MEDHESFYNYRLREPSKLVCLCKRLFDFSIGLVGTGAYVITYPIISLAIKLESPGPAIYIQQRVGINRRNIRKKPGEKVSRERSANIGGRPFTIYKYRSMHTDAELNGPQLSMQNQDPRITKVGRWLRTTHLDELPQFWNILKGEMSFIGPRPERPHFMIEYSKSIDCFGDRTLFTKPGLTGLAQIILGYDDSIESVIRKSFFDFSYSASLSNFWSWVRMESWIFFNTFYYLGRRVQPDGSINMPESLKRIHNLPMENRDKSQSEERKTNGFLRFNSFNNNIVLGNLSQEEIYKKVEMLGNFGQRNIEVTLTPDKRFDLEDMHFLVNLVHKVKEADGKLTIRNPHSNVQKILEEVHLDKIVHIEKIRHTINNFLTIDVECWFHAYNLKTKVSKSEWHKLNTRIVKNITRIIELLKKHHCSATFFVLGWVAEHYPEVVEMIDAEGFEIGSHGHFHNLISDMTPEEFEIDLSKSLNAISRRTKQEIIGYRGSNFTIIKSTLWALKIMKKYGIQYDSSIFPIGRNRYGIPDYPNRMPHTIQMDGEMSILEFPMSTLAVGQRLMPIAGGGYLRLYPYRLTDRYIEQLNLAGFPSMIYFHPWELDSEQARLNVNPLKKFQHYINLSTTDWKLSHLMERYKFTSVREGMNSRRILRFLNSNPVKVSLSDNNIAVDVVDMKEEKSRIRA